MKRIIKAILIVVFSTTTVFSYPGQVLDKFELSYSCPTGLAFDGTNIWLADRKSDEIICLSADDGSLISKIESPAYWPMGLTWDGKYLWNSDKKTNKIYQIDPDKGTILKSLPYPGKSPKDLAWDGEYLWIADNLQNKIYQISTTDGTTIKTLTAPASDIRGLAYDGKYLWCSDRIEDEIYMLEPESGTVIIITQAPGPFTRGLAFDKNNIWAVDYQNDHIYKLVYKDQENFRLSDQRDAQVRYTHQIKNFGPGNIQTLDIHVAIPKNRANQKIKDIQYNTKPASVETDNWSQETAHFKYSNIEPGSTINCVMTTRAQIFAVRHYLFPEDAGNLAEIPDKIKNGYLENNEKYQINHPYMQEILKQVVNQEQNTFWIARKIFNYLIENMYYERVGGWNTAPTVLKRGNGSCSEYTFAFIALCRAAGLPARYVGSAVVRGDDSSLDEIFHRWAEVYMPGYGWIPVDPSGGDKESPRDQADSFGGLSNRFLITTESGGGSRTMQWTYNSNAFYTTDPKTRVYSEHIAEWEPVKQRNR